MNSFTSADMSYWHLIRGGGEGGEGGAQIVIIEGGIKERE